MNDDALYRRNSGAVQAGNQHHWSHTEGADRGDRSGSFNDIEGTAGSETDAHHGPVRPANASHGSKDEDLAKNMQPAPLPPLTAAGLSKLGEETFHPYSCKL